MGCPAVLIKGGHGQGADSIDYLVRDAVSSRSPRAHRHQKHPRTGCSLSSAIAAGLAKGDDLETAVRNAKAWSAPRSPRRPARRRPRPRPDPSFS